MTEQAIDHGQTWRLKRPSASRVSSEDIQVVGMEYRHTDDDGRWLNRPILLRVIVAYWYPHQGLSRERRVRMRPEALRRSYRLVAAQAGLPL